MKYVFGPVPSRRLGLSLGIDPTVVSGPFNDDRRADNKVCNWNCAYCQLGHTRYFTTARASYYPPEAMFDELQETLAMESARNIDWITFVGSGEPTLSSDLGTMIRGVKSMIDIPVAVLTNGSLFSDIRVREDLMSADAVLPTLDAGTEELYRRINRPHPNYNFERIIRGMIAFRARYTGKLWIECMLIAGVNDDEASLHDIAAAMKRLTGRQPNPGSSRQTTTVYSVPGPSWEVLPARSIPQRLNSSGVPYRIPWKPRLRS